MDNLTKRSSTNLAALDEDFKELQRFSKKVFGRLNIKAYESSIRFNLDVLKRKTPQYNISETLKDTEYS